MAKARFVCFNENSEKARAEIRRILAMNAELRDLITKSREVVEGSYEAMRNCDAVLARRALDKNPLWREKP
jgi:hypothetical protein